MCDSQFKMLEFVSSWSNWAWEIQLGLAVRMQDAGVSGAGHVDRDSQGLSKGTI